MQGICIDDSPSSNLKMGETYFLFPHGSNHVYASRFNRKGSHFGAYEKRLFEVIQEPIKQDWPLEPQGPKAMPELDRSKVYKAELIWRKKEYEGKKLGTYYIKPRKTNCWFYIDLKLEIAGGCFPIHWFDNFREHDPNVVVEIKELPKEDWEQMRLF